MKKCVASVFVFLSIFFNTGIAQAITTNNVPVGTEVPIAIETRLNSDRLYSGDIAKISVVEDVVKDNIVIFKQGTIGYLTAEKVIRSGGHGRAGYIEIREARLKDVFGKEHNLQLNIIQKGESKRPSAIFLSVIGVFLILIPFGIWREGEPAVVNSNSIYKAVVTRG